MLAALVNMGSRRFAEVKSWLDFLEGSFVVVQVLVYYLAASQVPFVIIK